MKKGAIILAAGSSSRMGKVKQLLPVGKESMLRKTIRECMAAELDIIVVYGANAASVQSEIKDLPVQSVINPDWENGMGGSLKAGLRVMMESNSPDAIIVLVCDQPKLNHEHLNKLVQLYEETHNPIVASAYAGTVGVPALFDKTLFTELLSLSDDDGAKKVIKARIDTVATVPFPGGEIDLDTPFDYENFLRNLS